jgi:cytochrome c5
MSTTMPRAGALDAMLPAIAVISMLSAWSGPAPAARAERQGKDVYAAACIECHQEGRHGAPRIGDRPAWVPRLREGLDALVEKAVQGHGDMPARGGMASLSDNELRGAIVYMFNFGLPASRAAAPAAPVAPDPRHRLVNGTDVYLGMMRAEALRSEQRPQAVPAGKGYYHVNISLADHASSTAVSDAQVRLRVSDGMRTERKPLAVTAANNMVSYGNFFRLDSGSYYQIVAEIERPGVPGTLEAKFEFKAP